MGYIINDIVWWKVSILGFVNGWLPGFLTFFMGVLLSKISSRRRLRQVLKNSILGIFIPTFNTGSVITPELAQQAIKDLNATLNAYNQIYPGVFKKQPMEKLKAIFSQGFFNSDGSVVSEFMRPDEVIELIRLL